MKKHACSRCKKHVSKTMEVARKGGTRRNYCMDCIETMRNKGADIGPQAASPDERRRERVRVANENAVSCGTNRR